MIDSNSERKLGTPGLGTPDTINAVVIGALVKCPDSVRDEIDENHRTGGKRMTQNRHRKLNKKMDELFPQEQSDLCRVCNEPVVDGRWNYYSTRCRENTNADSDLPSVE